MMPKRVQRKRTKGWRMPANCIYVGRPTIFGNPFPSVEEFRDWLAGNSRYRGAGYGLRRITLLSSLADLRGKDLACWCGDKPCHADVLLKLANATKEPA